MTEHAREAKEDDEAEDLVDFARGLDIDQFLGDLEVKAAMEVVKERVRELKKKKKAEEKERKKEEKKRRIEELRQVRPKTTV